MTLCLINLLENALQSSVSVQLHEVMINKPSSSNIVKMLAMYVSRFDFGSSGWRLIASYVPV